VVPDEEEKYMGVVSEKQQGGPWCFIPGTNLVDKGLKALFFGVFLLFFCLFSVTPSHGKFSADALGRRCQRLNFIVTKLIHFILPHK